MSVDNAPGFGSWLIQRRKVLKLRQPDLADCVGCSTRKLKPENGGLSASLLSCSLSSLKFLLTNIQTLSALPGRN